MKLKRKKKKRVKGIFDQIKKPKFLGVVRPPSSQRFCVNCNCNRKFKLNPHINHSECTVCGSRYERRPKKKFIKIGLNLNNLFN
jgi:hypothetical protein